MSLGGGSSDTGTQRSLGALKFRYRPIRREARGAVVRSTFGCWRRLLKNFCYDYYSIVAQQFYLIRTLR